MRKLSEVISTGKLVGSRGSAFRKTSTSKPDDWRDASGKDVGAMRNAAHEKSAVVRADSARQDRERKVEKRTKEAEQRTKETLRMATEESSGTAARIKIKNVARPNDAEPTSEKSILAKNGEIKVKKVDEEIAGSISRKYGLTDSLIASSRAIMEKKTQVDLAPETDDKVDNGDEDDDDDMKKESKHTTPKSDKEKKLAALAHPKDKITHKDVLVGRGVLKKEEAEELDEISSKTLISYREKVRKQGDKQELSPQRQQGYRTAGHKVYGKDIKVKSTGPFHHKEEAEFTDEELERLESIAAQLDEAKPTVVSAPIRGANQDQSGFGVKKDVADYTISDSKKIKMKEQAELEEARRAKLDHDALADRAAEAPKSGVGTKYNPVTKHPWKPGEVEANHLYGTHRDVMQSLKRIAKHRKTHPLPEEEQIKEARGRPRKDGGEVAGDDTHKHPIQQLHKIAHAIEGSEPHFEHKDGTKSRLTKQLAKHITAVYGGMRTSQEKDNFAKSLHASRDSMMSAVSKNLR